MKITIRIPSPDLMRARPAELREVDAEECGVPGLAIHPAPVPLGEWSLTHVRSGLAVTALPSRADALRAARAVAPLADWTASGADLTAALTGSQVMDALAGIAGAYMPLRLSPGNDRADVRN